MIDEPPIIGDHWPTLAWIECEYITARLKHFEGNKTWTAKSLGITVKTLYNKIDKYQIDSSARVQADRELSQRERENAKLDRQASRIVRELSTAPLASVVPITAKERRKAAWKRTHGKDGRFLSPNPQRQEIRL